MKWKQYWKLLQLRSNRLNRRRERDALLKKHLQELEERRQKIKMLRENRKYKWNKWWHDNHEQVWLVLIFTIFLIWLPMFFYTMDKKDNIKREYITKCSETKDYFWCRDNYDKPVEEWTEQPTTTTTTTEPELTLQEQQVDRCMNKKFFKVRYNCLESNDNRDEVEICIESGMIEAENFCVNNY